MDVLWIDIPEWIVLLYHHHFLPPNLTRADGTSAIKVIRHSFSPFLTHSSNNRTFIESRACNGIHHSQLKKNNVQHWAVLEEECNKSQHEK